MNTVVLDFVYICTFKIFIWIIIINMALTDTDKQIKIIYSTETGV